MPRRAKTIIHVHQQKIRANIKREPEDWEPCLTIKRGKTNRYGFQAIIRDDEGREVGRVVYRPDKPLSCGARCWVETKLNVETVELDEPRLAAERTGDG